MTRLLRTAGSLAMTIVRLITIAGVAGVVALSIGQPVAGGAPAANTAPKTVSAPPGALDTLRRIAVQHRGRHKPFDSFARESVTFLTGAGAYRGQDPVVTVLSIMAYPDSWQDQPVIAVPFRPLREQLGMDRSTPAISYHELVERRMMRWLPEIVQKQQRDEKLSMLEQETLDVYERFVAFTRLVQQDIELVPPPVGSVANVWLSIQKPDAYPVDQQQTLQGAWTDLMGALRGGQREAIDRGVDRLATVTELANEAVYPPLWRRSLEVGYNRTTPFRAARLAYLLAAILLGFAAFGRPRLGPFGTGVLIVAYALHAADIALRVILGGRPPVSNFYETMLWLPFAAVTIALVFERLYRVQIFGLAAAVVAAIMLWLADVVPLDPSISPVVAVLRSNLWLTVHVLTIVGSYGALALAAVLAHVYAVAFLARAAGDRLAQLGLILYRAIQVGIVMLAAGIMLGAVWANASWGRYWGWDPKETWALITLLWFLAMLHGRFMGWLRGLGLAVGTILGCFLLVMTYYGVSFYLVGLHSYAGGHAKPVPPLLIGYVIAEVALVILVGVAAAFRRPPTAAS